MLLILSPVEALTQYSLLFDLAYVPLSVLPRAPPCLPEAKGSSLLAPRRLVSPESDPSCEYPRQLFELD